MTALTENKLGTRAESSQTFQIEGMTCGSCAARVDGALRGLPGVTAAAVNLTTGLARVEGSADAAAVQAAVGAAGYRATALADASAETLRGVATRGAAHERAVGRRLWFGLIVGGPLVAWDMFFHATWPMAHMGHGAAGLVLRLVVFSAVMVYTGGPYFVSGFKAAVRFAPNMDLLVAIGAGTAWVASVVSYMAALATVGAGRGTASPLLDEFHAAVAIVVLITLGKYLEARARKNAGSAVAALASQSAQRATLVLVDGSTRDVPAEQVAVGERVQVVAHQVVPVDGTLIEGAGSLDQSLITGESLPVALAAGGEETAVPAGAKLLDGRVVLRATRAAADSTVARILNLVQQAQSSKTDIQRLADRVAAVFVPIVLVLTLLTFLGWLALPVWLGHAAVDGHLLRAALSAAVATVVIACPCAMGLATPTAITVATGRGARSGILFTRAAALETARTLDAVLFDKTGTLTRGEFAVIDVRPAGEATPEARVNVLSLAAALEQFSDHPLAKAITARVREEALDVPMPESFSSTPGGGLEGTVAGVPVLVGHALFLKSKNVETAPLEAPATGYQAAGMTLVWVASGGSLRGVIALRDQLRPEAAEAVRQLHAQGVKVGVVSGDTAPAVRGTTEALGLDDIHAGVTPEGKVKVIEDLRAGGRRVAFVGDGVNDGPALAAANLGIAMGSATDVAKAAGDVVLVSGSLRGVPETLALSRHTLRIIKQNLFWAFAYNVAAIPLAAFGVLSPGVAAACMMLSSVTVVLNALRLYRVRVAA